MKLTRNVICVCCIWSIALTSAFIAVITPRKIRLGTDQKIFILGIGLAENDREYTVILAPGNGLSHAFYRQTHTVQNGVLTSIDINVDPSNIIPESTGVVTLIVRSTRDGGFERTTMIKLDKSPGYLFIQIDKPIYTSRQKVKYRVIAVDEDLRWAHWPVQISLLDPRGHLIDRITKSAREAFNGSEFSLSKNPMKGDWKIRASYTNFSTDSVVTFEVRDYVLPRFGLEVKCNSTNVYTSRSSPLKVSIKAEYVYGRPVHGSLKVTLLARVYGDDTIIYDRQPYQTSKENKCFIFTTENRTRRRLIFTLVLGPANSRLDSSGQAEIIYDDEEIKDHHIMGMSTVDLFIAINVTEDGTGIVLKKEFKLTTFSETPYTLSVINRRAYYQPGLPYTLELEANYPDGSIAVNVPVDIELVGQPSATSRTNNQGRIIQEYPAPNNGGLLQIKYRPEGLFDDELTLRVNPITAEENHSIKLSATQRPPLDQDLEVTVSYTTPPGLYFILVTSRGQVVFQESYTSGTNRDVRTIPRRVLQDMVPSARILVFYVANEHIVADSMILEMPNNCREELSLSKVGDSISYKPKETGQIRISGGPNMAVGLVAVDKGVYALKNEKSMTRKKMFENIAGHDMGSGAGDGADPVAIFKSAGFSLMYEMDYMLPRTGNLHTRRGMIEADAAFPEGDSPLLRSFFPESWLFQEETLNSEGESVIDVTYPDSITTWVMYAVGVSSDRGVCVSPVVNVTVSKNFFIDLDIPFKAVKLEEIRAKITVSNYLIHETGVTLTASADGLCMPDTTTEAMTYEEFTVPSGGKVTKTLSLLPVNAGSYVIRADVVSESGLERDAVKKQLVVVCEGEPKTKSITFSLDPNGERRDDITVRQTVSQRIQDTRVNMAFPAEAIPESEKIEITASGDLLGDVISNFVLGSKYPSDFDGVEGLMLGLAPSCFGLKYLSDLSSLSLEVLNKGREHIRHGLAELMKYRTPDGAYSLDEFDPDYDMEPSTWFTTFVLKALCSAKSVLAIDEDIVESGYRWLLSQVTEVRSRSRSRSRQVRYEIEETDPRMIEEEEEQLMAELLLSSYSCPHHMSPDTGNHRNRIKEWYKRDQRRRRHRSPLTLSKVSLALLTLHERNPVWRNAIRRLKSMKRQTSEGNIYWSESEVIDEEAPILYKQKPSSETIEATAYSLLVFIKDTAIATEALAKYRESKRISRTNLNVDVSTSPNETFTHTMVFDDEDAFQPKSLSDVPLGQNLHVRTEGSGLGQMHVDATYNIPIDVNANCQFDVSVQRYNQNFESILQGRTGLCSVCGTRLTCPKGDNFSCKRDSTTIGTPATHTYCLNVCLKHNSAYDHGKLFIKVQMLSGYVPNECDLQELEGDRVVKASYENEENFVHIQLKRVSAEEQECVGFRINKVQEVFRIRPALVTVRSFNVEEWTCPRQYAGGDEAVSRPFYCSAQVNNQMRGCSCINDECVSCNSGSNAGLPVYRNNARRATYVFKLRAVRSEDKPEIGAKHLIFHVETQMKSCLGDTNFENTEIIFVTKRECRCPVFVAGLEYWVMGNDYNTYTHEDGQTEFRFFLNENSYLLSSRSNNNFSRQSTDIRRTVGRRGSRERACPS